MLRANAFLRVDMCVAGAGAALGNFEELLISSPLPARLRGLVRQRAEPLLRSASVRGVTLPERPVIKMGYRVSAQVWLAT